MIVTVQTRRYQLKPECADEFVAWWRDTLVGLRAAAGFTVEFASYNPEVREFFWAVSAPGDRDAFVKREQAYLQSPAAVEAFRDLPERVESRDLRFSELLLGRSESER